MGALESEQKALESRFADADFYTQPKPAIAEAQARATRIEEELSALLERWEALGSR
ncbi:MAG: hypothetical protein ABW032_05930 [Burkholderiaceae bacterium]